MVASPTGASVLVLCFSSSLPLWQMPVATIDLWSWYHFIQRDNFPELPYSYYINPRVEETSSRVLNFAGSSWRTNWKVKKSWSWALANNVIAGTLRNLHLWDPFRVKHLQMFTARGVDFFWAILNSIVAHVLIFFWYQKAVQKCLGSNFTLVPRKLMGSPGTGEEDETSLAGLAGGLCSFGLFCLAFGGPQIDEIVWISFKQVHRNGIWKKVSRWNRVVCKHG